MTNRWALFRSFRFSPSVRRKRFNPCTPPPVHTVKSTPNGPELEYPTDNPTSATSATSARSFKQPAEATRALSGTAEEPRLRTLGSRSFTDASVEYCKLVNLKPQTLNFKALSPKPKSYTTKARNRKPRMPELTTLRREKDSCGDVEDEGWCS